VPFLFGSLAAKVKEEDKHVEASSRRPSDAGSIPAASKIFNLANMDKKLAGLKDRVE